MPLNSPHNIFAPIVLAGLNRDYAIAHSELAKDSSLDCVLADQSTTPAARVQQADLAVWPGPKRTACLKALSASILNVARILPIVNKLFGKSPQTSVPGVRLDSQGSTNAAAIIGRNC